MVHEVLTLCRTFETEFSQLLEGGEGGGEAILNIFETDLTKAIQSLPFHEVYSLKNVAQVINEAYREARDSYKLDLRLPGGIQLELFSFPSPPERPSYPEACGLRHLALATEDIDTCVELLIARGATPEPIRVDEYTGARFTFLADPDGTPIELYEVSP